MSKQTAQSRSDPPDRPIALVCVSRHEHAGPKAAEADKLTRVRGKWAWCPSSAESDHRWQPVAPGSLDALRVQLVEVSRLVDVALNTAKPTMKAGRRAKSTSSITGRPLKTRSRR